jgi:hypothetical protein
VMVSGGVRVDSRHKPIARCSAISLWGDMC